MKNRKCYALGFTLGLASLIPLSVSALTIGAFRATSASTGYLEVSEFDGATYLDVLVEVDSKPINYVLEQINDDLVLINISDKILEKNESLIEVSVESDLDSQTRSFAYRNDTAKNSIVSKRQAQDAYSAALAPTLKQVIVPTTNQLEDDVSAGELKDGIFHINITRGQTSVGTAVEHLARAKNLNVLILPGDRAVHDSLLVGSVSGFEDLYLASNKLVRHVYIDRGRQMVRIVGETSSAGANAFDLETAETVTDKSTNIGQLLKDIAMVNGYTALIYPGDADLILNKEVSWEGIRGIDDLALLLGESGGWLDIDRRNKLLRARKL